MDILSYIMSQLEINNLKGKIKEYDLDYEAKESTLNWYVDGEKKKSFVISGGSGNVNGTTISVRTSNSSIIEVFGNEVIVDFTFSSLYADGTSTGDGSMDVTIDNIKQIVAQPITQGDNKINITQYLKVGNHSVTVTVSDSKGNSDSIKITVQLVSLTLTSNYVQTNINTKAMQFPFVVSGTGEKTVYAYLDGKLFTQIVLTTTGRQSYIDIPVQTHGGHLLKLYAEADINGKKITSNVLYYDLIFANINDTKPIISSNYVKETSDQYNTISIPYVVYNPASLTSVVELYVNDKLVSTLDKVDRTLQTWNYRTSSYGHMVFKIVCGSTEKVFNIEIIKLATEITRVPGAELYYTAANGNNNSQDRDKWEYTDDKGVTTAVKFSDNFDWDNGGFISDSDGDPMLRIKSGTSITIPKKIFADDIKSTGKNIKFIFRASNCRTYDADVLKCMSGNKGISIKAQSATLYSEQSSVLAQYCEDKYIELDFVIGSVTNYRYIIPYLSGVPAKVELYPEGDDFSQLAPSDIIIGSEDCDVDFYIFSTYNSGLKPKEILTNFVADAKNSTEMLNRYARNDIYDDNGKIDLDKLPTSVRYTIMSAERVTTGKKDKVPCSVIHVDKIDNTKSFSAENAVHKCQGTSSAGYGEAGLNWDIDYGKEGFTLSTTGEHADAYSMTDNSIGANYFTYKVNIASSENANNACLTSEYEAYNPYIMPAKKADPRVRGTVYAQPDLLFFHNTLTNETSFYGIANMCNSKKNLEVFGQDREKYPNQFCVEFSNNTSLRCLFKTGDMDGWENDFEVRFPEDDYTQQDLDNWQRVLAWTASTDRTAPTNRVLTKDELAVVATWDNPTCTETKDTATYRAAKFTNQLKDYWVKDSLLYAYIFTERHSMVDNRGKNLFPQTDDGKLWHLSIWYDCDTGEGNNNEGDLILPYGCEDTDTIGSKDVFNASNSVLWCNVKDLLSDDLGKMFRDQENAGAWNADRICEKFDDFQACYPEAIWIEDFQKKYLNPYENSGTTAYLPMAYGKKTDQRYWWEHYQEPYMSSKYQGTKCINNMATLRCYTPDSWGGIAPNGNFTITPYADMYIVVKWASYTISKRAKRGTPVKMICPLDAGMNDTEVYIYGASYLSDIGDLAALYPGYTNFAQMTKLQSLSIGSSVSGYSNTNMTVLGLGNNKLLKSIQIENLPNLTQTIDCSACDTLEIFRSNGSGIAGATFSVGGKLKRIEMNKPSILNIRNQKYLTTFTVQNYTSLTTIRIENTPLLDIISIINNATNLNRIRIIGIDWNFKETVFLDKLTSMRGIDSNGNNSDNPIVSGTIYVDLDMKRSDVIYYEDKFTDVIMTCKSVIEDLLMDKNGDAITDIERCFIGVLDGAYTSLYTYQEIDNMVRELEG